MLIDDMPSNFAAALAGVQCVVRADPVAEMVVARELDARECALPNLRPPFDVMWIEFPLRLGGLSLISACLVVDEVRRADPAQHLVTHYAFIRRPDGDVGFEGVYSTVIQTDGSMVGVVGREAIEKCLGRLPSSTRLREHLAISSVGRVAVGVSQAAVAFMHAKNVTASEHKPDAALQKARQRRGKPPLWTHHTLNIEPMKNVLRTEGKLGSGNTLSQALHICRGHFKDYRQSGLFGKIKGIFWWDHHARGDVENGVRGKDYAVQAPAPIGR